MARPARLERATLGFGEPLTHDGRRLVEGLLGEPDRLRREGSRYPAIDITSSAWSEASDDCSGEGKPKKCAIAHSDFKTDAVSDPVRRLHR